MNRIWLRHPPTPCLLANRGFPQSKLRNNVPQTQIPTTLIRNWSTTRPRKKSRKIQMIRSHREKRSSPSIKPRPLKSLLQRKLLIQYTKRKIQSVLRWNCDLKKDRWHQFCTTTKSNHSSSCLSSRDLVSSSKRKRSTKRKEACGRESL